MNPPAASPQAPRPDGLSFQQAPPYSVPMRFFLTAPWFGMAAGVVLLVQGAPVFAARWSAPALMATHLLTLGFITMTMMGAVLQLVPVVAGAIVRRPRAVAWVAHTGLCAGAAGLAVGFSGRAPVAAAGWVLAAALVFWWLHVWAALARVRAAQATVWAMRVSMVSLAVLAVLGFVLVQAGARADVRAAGWTDLHAVWGLAGWVGVMIAGVAYQVVPMFHVTADYPAALRRGWMPVVAAGLLAFTVATAAGPGWEWGGTVRAAARAFVFGGIAVFALVTVWLLRRRRRRRSDVTAAFWWLGMACAFALSAVALSPLGASERVHVVLAAGALAGVAVSVISGMLYKIVPFLTWLHLTNRLFREAGLRRTVPNVHQILPRRGAWAQFVVHVAAVALVMAAAAAPEDWLARSAGAALAASCALLAVNLVRMVFTYRRYMEMV